MFIFGDRDRGYSIMNTPGLYYSPYTIRPLGPLNARSGIRERLGALIRTADGGVGCLHPWPELGDYSLTEELDALAAMSPLPLGRRALDCAGVDGAARQQGDSVWREDRRVPLSHATLAGTVTDDGLVELDAVGFRYGKIKADHDIMSLLNKGRIWRRLLPEWRWRLDFNGVLTREQWRAAQPMFMDVFGDSLDFCEDPFPWNAGFWKEVEESGIALALDWVPDCEEPEKGEYSPSVRILKPAAQTGAGMAEKRLVVTSYMDHPVGIAWAAYEAARMAAEGAQVDVCGLVTQHLYAPDDFSVVLGDPSPVFRPPSGTGLGFDDLIDRLEWKRLR